jgi:hypothetical protein
MSTATVLGAGLHYGISSAVYHADPTEQPSLSSGVARTLIEKTPAHAYLDHIRLGGRKREPTADQLLGLHVHGIIAGDVSEFSIGNFDDYRSKAAQTWRDDTKGVGLFPVLEKKANQAHEIAAALKEKAAIGITNNPFVAGQPEVTGIWQEDGFWFRARYDRLVLDPGSFADAWDWKTTGNGVTADSLERTIIEHGYHIQAAHYLRGLAAIAPEYRGRTSFILVFVETEPPYAVRRVPICEGFLSIGSTLLSRAIDRWKHCLSTKTWPDDSGGTLTITPPAWYLKKVEEAA